MDMSTGSVDYDNAADEFGQFTDVVQNAEWVRPCPELQLALQSAVSPVTRKSSDTVRYLAAIFRHQH